MIKRTLYAVGESDTRYILNGLLLSFSPVPEQAKRRPKDKGALAEIRMVGTDGHRLALAETQIELHDVIGEENFILPKKGCLN